MWQQIVNLFSQLLQFCYQLTEMIGWANYGLAIIFITIFIKICLYPLTNTQLKSMRTMQELQPKLKALQEQYKDTPEKLQAETMKLYKDKGFNPLGGCLPLLVQMPILFAFYQALIKFKYVDPSQASFLWIPSLSQADPIILPILAAATTYYQQRISTAGPPDATQKTMMYTMPLFIGWMAHSFAAGLALYWVMFNILSILQQMYVNYKHPKMAIPAVSGGESSSMPQLQDSKAEKEDLFAAPGTERDKGGKTSADGRKKGKKR